MHTGTVKMYVWVVHALRGLEGRGALKHVGACEDYKGLEALQS